MAPLATFQPHREQPPSRECGHDRCDTLLSSANSTNFCWMHGGWLEIATPSEQGDSFAELMEGVWA